jgi:hypothetical protein
VVPLNAVLRELQRWHDTPLLLLAGNHDQVCVCVLCVCV